MTSRTTRIAITHRFEQRFDEPVRLATHWLRLRPAPQTRARIAAYSLQVHTQPHFLNWVRDPLENYLARLDFPEIVGDFRLELELHAELEPVNPFDFLTEGDAFEHPFEYSEQLQKELLPYLARSEPGPRLRKFLDGLLTERTPKPTVERLIEVNRVVSEALPFKAGSSDYLATQRVDGEQLLGGRDASAWQLAWLLAESLRHLGIAARFACGQRVVLATSDPVLDHATMHAWAEAYVPGAGWIGLDPSAGLLTNELYIPFASAPDLLRVRPIVGYREGTPLRESVRVRRLEPEQPSWPFTNTQWSDIRALGAHVDQDLAEQQVSSAVSLRLSFVSGVHVGAPEWNSAALGPTKRYAADALLERLQARLGTGGVTQLGQGEWFSGEALPRWKLAYVFRADGQPLWRQRTQPTSDVRPNDVYAFTEQLARALGVPLGGVLPAYEDPLHAMWRGYGQAPQPNAADLDDPVRRRQLAQRLSEARGEVTGYVLPLAWDAIAQRFRTGIWTFRRDGLFLAPGDSPLGYRLPLGSLVFDEQSECEAQLERSPFEERSWLSEPHADLQARMLDRSARDTSVLQGARAPRTALCVQARAGKLFVFVPPLSHLEHYVELVAAIDVAAEAARVNVQLEGYDPPEDPRLRRIVLEPDSGVLRVTLPETDSWAAHLDVIQTAYDEAEHVGLCAQRLMIDGALLPPGGGSTLWLGGARPAESPFLQRPELLRALIAYWQEHPCLSYLFTGRLIGSAAPAPRVDEGRDEALYELSIGLSQLENSAREERPLWHSDRVLRHLLTDLAGNLKRAEIRVDQLYAPERAGLRQGRIAIGSFETAPHAQIAALHSLLVRALLGHFARSPESGQLQRWGTALHDRFLLPHILWQDLQHVLADLRSSGYPFQEEWFQALQKRRFPVLGTTPIGTITLELQTAHEPWPLLAEEMTSDGITRFIDAANERLQTRLTGLTPGRYVLACNGQRVPLQPTPVHGEFVAGVRYKIANPIATLHPTLPPVGALVFDLIDLWTGRAVGGATYLPPQPQLWGPVAAPVSAPPPPTGDLTEPVRAAPLTYLSLTPIDGTGRFLPHGSKLGPMAVPHYHHDPEYPYLLDLTQRL